MILVGAVVAFEALVIMGLLWMIRSDRASERAQTDVLVRAVMAKGLPDLTASITRAPVGGTHGHISGRQSIRHPSEVPRIDLSPADRAFTNWSDIVTDKSRPKMPSGLDGTT